MSQRILITGSADGIGLASAQRLTSQGHAVWLHARNADRAEQAKTQCPGAAGVLIADLSSLRATKNLAAEANKLGPFDAVVHNAGLGLNASQNRNEEGVVSTFAVNSLAPYVLASLMAPPKRLLFLSSSLHNGGDESLRDLGWKDRSWNPSQAYSDSKLHDVLLAKAFATRLEGKGVQVCALDPGWVRTKMGGQGAPGSTEAPAKAIAEFAVGEGKGAVEGKSGVYFNPSGVKTPHRAALSVEKQDLLMRICEEISGVAATFLDG